MSEVVQVSGSGVIREGQLTLSPVAQRLQQVGHEILNNGGLTHVEEDVFSTCPEPIEVFTERLLRSRDVCIPLVEIELVGSEAGYARVNQLFGIDGRTIDKVLYATGVEQTDRFDNAPELNHEAVGLSMFSADELLRLIARDIQIDTCAEFGHFRGYVSGLTDRWGMHVRPTTAASYLHENGTCIDLPSASPMHRILDMTLVNLQQALRAEGSIPGTAEEIVDLPQIARGPAGYLDASC